MIEIIDMPSFIISYSLGTNYVSASMDASFYYNTPNPTLNLCRKYHIFYWTAKQS